MVDLKYYEQSVSRMKTEMLDEVRLLLGSGRRWVFVEPFYVHYVEGEVATTDKLFAVASDDDGNLGLDVETDGMMREHLEGEMLMNLNFESFIDLLTNIRKEIREEKVSLIKKMVSDNGGVIYLIKGGDYVFPCADEGNPEMISTSYLNGIVFSDGQLLVQTTWDGDGERYDYGIDCIMDDTLDDVIRILKEETEKTYHVVVQGCYSRMFEINATSEEEAIELAKNKWKVNPLCLEDSNGEDWFCRT